MAKKFGVLLIVISIIATLGFSPALMSEEIDNTLVIGEGYVNGDPNKNFDSLPETEGIYGVKLDSTDEDWKYGVKFQLPSEPVMMYASDKTNVLVNISFDVLYVLIKAGSVQSGGGDWVFMLNPEGEFELLSFPGEANDHYTVILSDNIITVTQTDENVVKDISHISFFFKEGEDNEEESSSEESSSDESSSIESSYEELSYDDSVLDESDESSADESEDSSEDESLIDEYFEDEIDDDFDEEQPNTGTIIFRLFFIGFILLTISVLILYFQRRKLIKS